MLGTNTNNFQGTSFRSFETVEAIWSVESLLRQVEVDKTKLNANTLSFNPTIIDSLFFGTVPLPSIYVLKLEGKRKTTVIANNIIFETIYSFVNLGSTLEGINYSSLSKDQMDKFLQSSIRAVIIKPKNKAIKSISFYVKSIVEGR